VAGINKCMVGIIISSTYHCMLDHNNKNCLQREREGYVYVYVYECIPAKAQIDTTDKRNQLVNDYELLVMCPTQLRSSSK
jgi:hypothetical protein